MRFPVALMGSTCGATTGMGSGVGAVTGVSTGTGVGARIIGLRPLPCTAPPPNGLACGVGTGIGVGTGVGVGTAVGVGTGIGLGTGVGLDTDIGLGTAVGVGTAVPAVGMGIGTDGVVCAKADCDTIAAIINKVRAVTLRLQTLFGLNESSEQRLNRAAFAFICDEG